MARIFHAAWLMLVALAVPGCSFGKDEMPDYRYRLTVEVETPDGLRAGSSVIEIEQSMGRSAASGYGKKIMRRTRGEAVAVDLPGGKTLFALLRSETDVEWAAHVMQMLAPETPGEPWEEVFDNVLLIEGKVEVPRKWRLHSSWDDVSAYPMLVTFGDLSDPISVANVDPEHLAATFGEGVRLKRITVELTDDAVTTAIEERLGWLSEYPEPRLDPNYRGSTNPNLSQSLWHGDFRKRQRF